jgi:hypothetical protein
MKTFLIAAIAALMMAGTSVAAGMGNNSVADNVVIGNQQNAVEKVIALIKGYTKKIDAVKSVDELMKVAEQCFEEMTAFEEKYADEIIAMEETLTEAKMKKYEAELEKAMIEFEAAVDRKAKELMVP